MKPIFQIIPILVLFGIMGIVILDIFGVIEF